jgi:hypothetical protein
VRQAAGEAGCRVVARVRECRAGEQAEGGQGKRAWMLHRFHGVLSAIQINSGKSILPNRFNPI